MSQKVVIASKNPVKQAAVQNGFKAVFNYSNFDFAGISVESEVSDQPKNDQETLMGATNRANNARKLQPGASYWVGIEGGIEQNDNEMVAFAWVVIISENNTGKAKTASFFLPNKVVELVKEGKELGVADDEVFGTNNSKQKSGAVGLLTDNIIDRERYYTEAVILALIPFKKPHLY